MIKRSLSMGDVEIKGTCSDAYVELKEAFAANFADGLEIGASLCLSLHGETIVDIFRD